MPRVTLPGQKITPSTWPDGIKESRQIQDPAVVGHLKMHSALPFYFLPRQRRVSLPADLNFSRFAGCLRYYFFGYPVTINQQKTNNRID